MNKKMKIFISISVLLNVLLLGAIIGNMMAGISKYPNERNHSSVHEDKRLARILEVLPQNKKEDFEEKYLKLKALKYEEKINMRAARKNIIQTFESEPFDKLAYQQAVIALNNMHQLHVNRHMELMADVAQYLSPKERKQLARLMMKRGARK
jgi:uncharacterized membrane protein|tara:strand:+ start:627 stop:1082 length:456 start_codon:yes stop_codon:yes gene_type:complete